MMRLGSYIIFPIIFSTWVFAWFVKRGSCFPIVLFSYGPLDAEIGCYRCILNANPLMTMTDFDISVILNPCQGRIDNIVIQNILSVLRLLLSLT